VVISDLAAADSTEIRLINRALEDARAELGRQECPITPVDLSANEIYDILRNRPFSALPDEAEIDDIADSYGRSPDPARGATRAACSPAPGHDPRLHQALQWGGAGGEDSHVRSAQALPGR